LEPQPTAVEATWRRLTPVILATQEAEIRRIMVGSQPEQTVEKPYLKKDKITSKGWRSALGSKIACLASVRP
jgi:hypothetical protein